MGKIKICSFIRILIPLMLIAGLVTPSFAATYYVAVNGGSDSNPGTESAPFKTIAKGSRALAAGDTLLIRKGTYNERMMHGYDGFVFQNGTASAHTRYAAYNGEQVIIKPANGGFVAWFSRRTEYVEVSDMILDGSNVEHNVVKMDGGKDLYGRHNRLLRNEIKKSPYSTKSVSVLAKGPNEFIGNKIHSSNSYGMYLTGDNGLVEGNIIHDNAGYAIHLFDQNHSVNGWVIRNNIIFNNGGNYRPSYRGNALRPLPAVVLTRGSSQFYNNLVYNNPYGGVSVGLGARDTLVANNTVYGNGVHGIGVGSSYAGSRNTRVINNIAWGNRGAQIANTGTNTTLQNNLTTDPKFVNPSAGDFGIQAGSPAIDKGMTLAQVPDDFTGKKRPEGAAYDIGAFEGAGSRKDDLPGMSGGLPPGAGGGGPVFLGPNGEVCYSGF